MNYLIWFIPLMIMAFVMVGLSMNFLTAFLGLAIILALIGAGKFVVNNWGK